MRRGFLGSEAMPRILLDARIVAEEEQTWICPLHAWTGLYPKRRWVPRHDLEAFLDRWRDRTTFDVLALNTTPRLPELRELAHSRFLRDVVLVGSYLQAPRLVSTHGYVIFLTSDATLTGSDDTRVQVFQGANHRF